MSVVRVLCLDRGEVAAGVFVEPSVVVPVDPFGGLSDERWVGTGSTRRVKAW